MIKDFEPRLYQETIFHTATKKNTLVVLPTGMGKTNIFLMLSAFRLHSYPNSKILLIGPTKPLIDQYYQVFLGHFEIDPDKMAIFTGMVKPEERQRLWQKSTIIFSTPQGLENDIISNRINLKEVSLLGIDEAHRAVGNYSYVWVAKQYEKNANFPRIIAMTASPGSDIEKIQEVCNNLFIEEIESRTQEDPDVRPYVQEIKIDWVKVKLPLPFVEIQEHFKSFIYNRTRKLKDWGILRVKDLNYVSRKDLLGIQADIRGRIASGEKDFVMWNAISVLAEIMKIAHASELLESQGIVSLQKYLEKISDEGRKSSSKAVKNVIADADFRNARYKTEKLFEQGLQHPKLVELQKRIDDEIKKDANVKVIVFNQYRENALDIKNTINKIDGVRAEIFVGQQKKGETGLTQKAQKEMLDKFRENEFNVIVATSIGEEGLDIPKVDLVIFFEPVPSAIRSIQRRGRTGRSDKGRVIILMTEKTKDETYRWAEHHQEKRMYRNLSSLKGKLKLSIKPKEVPLENFSSKEEKFKIFVDHRERGNPIIKELLEIGADVRLEKLENADYLLSSRVGVEFKTKQDFINSIIDGRLLIQLKNMRENFSRPILMLEGDEDIYSIRNVHPNAIRGMIATAIVSYGIPILQTKNAAESAAMLYTIAKREQEEGFREINLHQEKPSEKLKHQQEYVVAALPNVGPGLSRELLKKFGSVKNVVNASEKDLEGVPKIGKVIAKKIKEVVDSSYEGKN